MISREDILNVAKSLSIELHEEEIQLIIESHDRCCESDPTATWDLVVEQQIYDVIKPHKFNDNDEIITFGNQLY